jgi:hypothetical protein
MDTTIYAWKYQNGTSLVKGIDYDINNGITVFLKSQPDSVYCEMTNASFPDMTGPDALKTTYTKIFSSTSQKEILTDWYKVYSVHKTIYIDLTFDAQLFVYDISGRLVSSKPLYIGTNCTSLNYTGIYLVNIISNKRSVTQKVIIQ